MFSILYYEKPDKIIDQVLASAHLPCVKEVTFSSDQVTAPYVLRLNSHQYVSTNSYIDPIYQLTADSYQVTYTSKDFYATTRPTLMKTSSTDINITAAVDNLVQIFVQETRNFQDLIYFERNGDKPTIPTNFDSVAWKCWNRKGLGLRYSEIVKWYHQDDKQQDYFNQANRLLHWRYTLPEEAEFITGQLVKFPEQWHPADTLVIDFDCPEDYHPMNCSLWTDNDGELFGCWRTVNYRHDTQKGYISEHDDGHIRTQSYTVRFSSDMDKFNIKQINNLVEYPSQRQSMVHNLEDQRLFKFGKDWYTIGTGIDTHFQSSHQMVLSKLDNDGDIVKMIFLDYDQTNIQKNWIPFPFHDKMLFIYRYEPFTLIEADLETGKCHTHLRFQQLINCKSLRGSSCPIRYQGKYLMVVHRSFWFNRVNTYAQKLIEFTEDFRITRYSNYFKLTNCPMEYVMGCAFTDHNKMFHLTLSENDANPRIVSFTQEDLESRLHAV